MGVILKDNSKQVFDQFGKNKLKALAAIGEAAVEVTADYMKHKYGEPIYLTGGLLRSISKSVRPNDDAVDVGTSLNYGEHVHNGTAKMPARPFLRDALLENTDIWRELAAEHLGS